MPKNAAKCRRGVVEALHEKKRFYNLYSASAPPWENMHLYNAFTTLQYDASKAKKKNASTSTTRFCNGSKFQKTTFYNASAASQRHRSGVMAAFLGVVINIR